MTDIDQICSVLDRLTLDALTLMEEQIQIKLNIENAMCGGETHLAKSRYILGQNSVSSLQLPTENSPEFDAMTTVHLEESDEFFGEKSRELEVSKKEDQIDPVRWFGYLVPQDLYHAQSMFKQALQWIIRGANVQTNLIQTCNKIQQLKELKKEVLASN
ncbi:Coiled-coil domain-containing protein 115-like Protein [Tribolium castaneum]|uniref:Vacuolar ATPase assembly protein VMA22 n=2 Tax=Tribolium castaneum TaxID=7070 RepID=D6WY99_TRICA|nr:Coiled-coil domain-containing protein 115-like Protein [Tribolium castaneum]